MFFRLEDLRKILKTKCICYVDGHRINTESEEELDRYRNYLVVSVFKMGALLLN